ncbi:gluconate kinase [Longimycelium tulufanense]|uniref:Gluconate kinase n=1 Tax=Longimycelium tulufanense TaxID=907463 RepID=A0A8J3FWJ0_9PSEU|nr:gluconokinase [Longimycelium tulufanense]GGM77563.1 gluconate kinase [Longimycelium tulufanense]
MTTARNVILGVDIGTSATKVVAADRNGGIRAIAEHGYPLHIEKDQEAVHDPGEVLHGALAALRSCARTCAEQGSDVAGLALGGAMHTLLALDSAHRPLTPSLSWADSRATGEARRLRGEGLGRALHQATGTPVHPMSPLTKLMWFAEHEPGLAARAAHWCGLKDLALFHLTGRFVTEYSSASGTGLLSLANLAWHPAALETARVRAEQLPELVAPTEVLALSERGAQATGLPAGLPVIAGGADGPLANLGVGAVLPGMTALSLGSSGALRVARDAPCVGEGCQVFCYALGDGVWVLGGAISNGGLVGEWAADLVGEDDVADLMEEAASVPPGAHGLLALPYLLGERAPWWDPEPRGVLLGLRREHSRAEIIRALAEGVAQQLALVRDAVVAAGGEVRVVRATGGAFRSPLWATLLAAALDTELEMAEDRGGSGLGAALLGWRALGAFDSLCDVAELVRPRYLVHPDPETARQMAAARPMVRRVYAALRELSEDCAMLAPIVE